MDELYNKEITAKEIEIYNNGLIETISAPNINKCSFIGPDMWEIVGKCNKLLLKHRDYGRVFAYALACMCNLSGSDGGIICSVKDRISKTSVDLEGIAIIIPPQNEDDIRGEECRKKLDSYPIFFPHHSLDNLFGRSIIHEKIIISTDYQSDPRKTKLPEDHFQFETFISFPIKYRNEWEGTISMTGGLYNTTTVLTLYPLLDLISYIIHLYRKKLIITSNGLDRDVAINDAKDDFLSLVSHEIKTPLTGIIGMAQMIPEAGPLNDKQKEYMKMQFQCIGELMDLLNDLLDFSKMRAHRMILRCQPFDLKECIDASVALIRGKATMKGIGLNINFKSPITRILGDERRLKQVIVNLLSNSVKYTDRGNIKITIKATKVKIFHTISGNLGNKKLKKTLDVKKWKLDISIKDTGLGVKPEEHKSIFELFRQGNSLEVNPVNTSKGGIGLGLSICKDLVKLMGGTIKVESEGIPGIGSVFSFNILVEEELDIKDLIKTHTDLLKRTKILAVDDKKENRIILSEMLFRWGVDPTIVGSAEEAIFYLMRSSFDVAIIDIHMPLMSGIQLAQRITKDWPSLSMIAISSVGENAKGKEWFDWYLSKPIIEHKLLPKIISCVDNSILVEDRENQKKDSPRKKLTIMKEDVRILIAEDDPSNSYTIKEMLLMIGFKKQNIMNVDNGHKCVKAIRKDNFDLCIMDIRMPVLNGIDATRKICAMSDSPPTIIGISAGASDMDKERCSQAGMTSHLSKPIKKEDLEQVLSNYLTSS